MNKGTLHAQIQVVEAEFKIENFAAACVFSGKSSGKKGFRECVSGPIFQAKNLSFGLGIVWGVDGDRGLNLSQEVGLVIACLAKKPEQTQLSFRAQLSLVNANPKKIVHKSDDMFDDGNEIHDGWRCGWTPNLDKNSHIGVKLGEILDESKGWLQDGALIIRSKFEFVATAAYAETSVVQQQVKNGHLALNTCLKALLTSGDLADVAINVAGESLPAHSLLLSARSQVFRTMLCSPMKEGHEKEVNIQDISPAVMKGLLGYLYTGSIEAPMDEDEFSSGLLHAAHRFEIKELLQECEQVMASRISISNAASWFELADLLGCQDLRAACLRCIHQNLAEIQGTEGYELLVERRPALLKDIIAAVTPPVKSANPPAKRRRK